jgi:hypothetical protein
VIVDCDHVDSVLPKGLQNGIDFVFEHGYIASDRGVLVGTYESGPVLRPIRALMAAPCSFILRSSRPTVIL